jgi:hypothetical protein
MTAAGSKFDALQWKIKNPTKWRSKNNNAFDTNSMGHHFAAGEYLKRNPDVAKNPYYKTRPYEHYLKHGKSEGRKWGLPAKKKTRRRSTPKATLPAKVSTAPAPAKKEEPPPELNLPELKLNEDTSVVNQINKLASKDSLLRQQARDAAHERGAATGGIHSSQQAGASERAVLDKITPLATAEANRAATEQLQNWQQDVKKNFDVYQKQYTERLAKMGYDNAEKLAMSAANTSLSTALLGNITRLLNNPEIDFGVETKNKLVDIFNAAQDNNNAILGLGFTY